MVSSCNFFMSGSLFCPLEEIPHFQPRPFLVMLRESWICKRLKVREEAFDLMLPNRGGVPIAKSCLDDFIAAARHEVEGRPDIVPPESGYRYPSFGERIVRVHHYLSEGVAS